MRRMVGGRGGCMERMAGGGGVAWSARWAACKSTAWGSGPHAVCDPVSVWKRRRMPGLGPRSRRMWHPFSTRFSTRSAPVQLRCVCPATARPPPPRGPPPRGPHPAMPMMSRSSPRTSPRRSISMNTGSRTVSGPSDTLRPRQKRVPIWQVAGRGARVGGRQRYGQGSVRPVRACAAARRRSTHPAGGHKLPPSPSLEPPHPPLTTPPSPGPSQSVVTSPPFPPPGGPPCR